MTPRAQNILPPTAPADRMFHVPMWLRERALLIITRLGYSYQDFAEACRDPRLVRARMVAVYVLRHWVGPGGNVASWPQIARATGRRNHSTVLTQYRRMQDKPDVMRDAEEILRDVTKNDPRARARLSPVLMEAGKGRI